MNIILKLVILAAVMSVAASSDDKKKVANETKSPIEFYRNLFRMKRKDHIMALENLLLMDDVEKQANLIIIMLQTIVKTVVGAKETLINNNYNPGNAFPEKEEVKDALSMVLENTALFTDLVVRFPFISRFQLSKNTKAWNETIIWAKEVCEKSGVFVDGHEKILQSLGQEMGLDDHDPNYQNPFKKKPATNPQTSEERLKEYEEKKRKEKMKSKKKKKQSGPKLSKKVEL